MLITFNLLSHAAVEPLIDPILAAKGGDVHDASGQQVAPEEASEGSSQCDPGAISAFLCIFAVRSGRPGARIFLQDSSLSCRILCATCWGLRLGSLLYEATSLSPLSP